jgi:hypothetical protein
MGTLKCHEAIATAMAHVVTEAQLIQILELAKSKVAPDCLGHDWHNAICPLILWNATKDMPVAKMAVTNSNE